MKSSDAIYKSGALWAGILLILLPISVLSIGMKRIADDSLVGLPILAIFGICILFGACALVAVIFAQFGLTDTSQALALPEGSIRATIALSLIVLFAIIAIMLHQSSMRTKKYVVDVKSVAAKLQVISDNPKSIEAILPLECSHEQPPQSLKAGAEVAEKVAQDGRAGSNEGAKVNEPAKGMEGGSGNNADKPQKQCFSIHLRVPIVESSAASDLAKQLLVLVGTLMTSVTSFYFASRGTMSIPPATTRRPTLNAIIPNPAAIARGDSIDMSIAGTDLESITDVRLERPGAAISASKVMANKDRIECSIPTDEKTPEGDWILVALDDQGRKFSCPDGFKLSIGETPKDPGQANPAQPTIISVAANPLSVASSPINIEIKGVNLDTAESVKLDGGAGKKFEFTVRPVTDALINFTIEKASEALVAGIYRVSILDKNKNTIATSTEQLDLSA